MKDRRHIYGLSQEQKVETRLHLWCVRGGFNMVELLCAIGIAAILVLILLSTYSRVHSSMLSSECASRARVLTQGWLLFAADRGGRVMNSLQTPGWQGLTDEYWIVQMRPYVGGIKHNGPGGDKVYFCTEPCPITKKRAWIGMNEQLDPNRSPVLEPPSLGQFEDPARTVVFSCATMELYHQKGNLGTGGSPYGNSFTYPHHRATSSNFSFADGHVESIVTRSEDGRPIKPSGFIYNPRTGQ
jgi:prepilin-type N-terminal cleavage/methylation domain-containing protein/prepilin-type processing-associated H-X9-DG protein